MQTISIFILHLRKLRSGKMNSDETCEKGSISKRPELRVSEFPCLHLMGPQTASAPGFFPHLLLWPVAQVPPFHVLYWLLRARDQRKS